MIEPVKINNFSCPNCDHLLSTDHKFCPACGQQRIEATDSFNKLVGSFLGDYFTFDSKILGSLKPLLFNPGRLTKEYIVGRRVRYISPLRMYIFISLIFFLILSWGVSGSPLKANNPGDEVFWNSLFGNYLPKLFFVFLPLFAAILNFLVKKTKVGYFSCLVFALHFHSFVFFVLIFYLFLSRILASNGLYHINTYFLLTLFLWFIVYLFISLKRVFNIAWVSTIFRFLTLLFLYFGLISCTVLIIMAVITFRGG